MTVETMSKASVDSALEILRDPQSRHVQIHAGLVTLLSIARQPRTASLIRELGGASVLVDVMAVNRENSYVQELGCHILGFLSNDPAGRAVVVDAGGVHAVVDAMRTHIALVTVALRGLNMLCKLTSDDHAKDHIISGYFGHVDRHTALAENESAIKCVVEAMQTHPDFLDVQLEGCAIFHNIAMDDKTRHAIGRAGGIDTALQGMENFRHTLSMQTVGCDALYRIACSYATSDQVGKDGGIRLIVRAMKDNPGDVLVFTHGCRALGQLAIRPHNCLVIGKNSDMVVYRLRSTSTDKGAAQIHACRLLRNLARCEANRVRIARVGGVSEIVELLSEFGHNARVLTQACAAIQNLASGEEDVTFHSRQRIAQLIVSDMYEHIGNWTFCIQACNALKALVDRPMAGIPIIYYGGIKAVVLAIEYNLDYDKELQRVGFGLLQALSQTPGRQTEVVKQGGLAAVMAVMGKDDGRNADVQIWGCMCLTAIALDADNRAAIVAAGGVDLVSDVLGINPSTGGELYDIGHTALAAFLQ
jgi:hypothetical protein